jgi:ABC-type Fe3+/spermidine/putrescine transport system ATPase subunit
MLAGLEPVSSGRISIGGRDVTDLAPGQRGIAMVFQQYALYPHMTVRDNMAFGLRNIRMDEAEIERRVTGAAQMLELQALLERKPVQLSGGQRQRVAIGRAVVKEPLAFLFDEPLSNLDAALRTRTRLELARLHKRLGATMLFVTHDQVEAMTLANRIAVMNQGRIEQFAAPMELYERPATRFVAGFVGSPSMNFLPVRRAADDDGYCAVTLANGTSAHRHRAARHRRRAGTGPAPGRTDTVAGRPAARRGRSHRTPRRPHAAARPAAGRPAGGGRRAAPRGTRDRFHHPPAHGPATRPPVRRGRHRASSSMMRDLPKSLLRTPRGTSTGWTGLLFVAPFLLCYLTLLVWPLLNGVWLSFHAIDLLSNIGRWVGAVNFIDLLQDEMFVRSAFNTVLFAALCTPAMVITGLALALALNRPGRATAILRGIFFGAGVLSVTIVTLIWRLVLMPDRGMLANLMHGAGLASVAPLDNEWLALPAVALATSGGASACR